MQIEPNLSPWLTETLVDYHLDGLPNNCCFCFMLAVHNGYGCLRVESLIPGSFVFDLLKEKQVGRSFLVSHQWN
jgi:hypothetical protein